MLAHHLLFPGTPKGLNYLSSLYCRYHWYWKEDHKEWDMRGSIEQLLEYNALDCLRNFEVNTVLHNLIPKMGMEALWPEEMEKNQLALEMINRGVRIDTEERGQFLLGLIGEADSLAFWFEKVLPQAMVSPDAKRGVAAWWASPASAAPLLRLRPRPQPAHQPQDRPQNLQRGGPSFAGR